MRTEIAIADKYALTIEQAASYFGIGQNKLRWMIDANKDAVWILMNGSKILIKRRLFEEFLDATISI